MNMTHSEFLYAALEGRWTKGYQRCLQHIRRLMPAHRRYLEPFVGHPLFDIQQHTYSHTLLKDDRWKGGTFLASPIDTVSLGLALVLFTVWFFLVPIVYHQRMVSERVRTITSVDPMRWIIEQFRDVLYDGHPRPEPGAAVKAILFDNVLAWLTFAIAPLLNYLWALWDDRNEALHDKLCGTRVVEA